MAAVKKIGIAVIVLMGFLQVAYGQILNQDASGNSAIVTPGTAINLNITATQIQLIHYGEFAQKGGMLSDPNKTGIWGINLSANNSTGVGSLYDAGKFSPGGTLSGLIGFRHVKFTYPDNQVQTYGQLLTDLNTLQTRLGQAYEAEVLKGVNSSGIPALHQPALITELSDLDKKEIWNLPQLLAEYKTAVITDAAQLKLVDPVVKALLQFTTDHAGDINKLQQINTRLQQGQQHLPTMIRNTTTYWYLRSGVSASQFTYDQGGSIADYTKRFTDTTNVTYFFELGVSHQFKKNFIGVNLGYSRLSNMAALTSSDYSYSTQDTTINTGKLSQSKAFTAYAGKYGFYSKLYLNLDYQHLITLDTSKYLAVGPYLRWNYNLNAGSLAKNSAALGVSFNYLDGAAGKFLGGIYLQSDDITGQTQPQFKKSIQFGLVVKFSLSSIFILQ